MCGVCWFVCVCGCMCVALRVYVGWVVVVCCARVAVMVCWLGWYACGTDVVVVAVGWWCVQVVGVWRSVCRVGVTACCGMRTTRDGDALTTTTTTSTTDDDDDDDDDDDGRRRGNRRRRRRASSPGESRSPRDRAIPPTRHATGRERGGAMLEPLRLGVVARRVTLAARQSRPSHTPRNGA